MGEGRRGRCQQVAALPPIAAAGKLERGGGRGCGGRKRALINDGAEVRNSVFGEEGDEVEEKKTRAGKRKEEKRSKMKRRGEKKTA